MTTPSAGFSTFESLYARAVRLYPAPFREDYGAALQQAFRDALADRTLPRRVLIPLIVKDLILSLAKEHFAMLRETFGRPALLFNALILAGISTVLAQALYSIPQQVLRQGANDPQVQLAGDLVARLEEGVAPSEAVPAQKVDMAHSLAPFVIAYDVNGQPLASQAQLNGATPIPPRGVFEYVRQHGEERVSWQPILGRTQGLRIAAVVQRVGGAHPGFVLAGRSMREVEDRIDQVQKMASLAWMAMLGLIFGGTMIFGRYTRKNEAA